MTPIRPSPIETDQLGLLATAVATVVNEMRVRLASLQMAVDFCGATAPLSPQQSEFLMVAREDCATLGLALDELAVLADIHAGTIELGNAAVSAAMLLENAVAAHAAAADDARIALRIKIVGVVDPVLADHRRVATVLAHLIANALRHTPPEGAVELSAASASERVRFEVRDNGTGIHRDALPDLFDPLHRAPHSVGRGAGLGLYICRALIEAQGGEMGVESELDRGTLFWFTLPRAPE